MNRLQQLRVQKGDTQKDIALMCKITERGYRKIENGEVKPSCDVIIALQRYYSKTIDYLLEQIVDTTRIAEG